MKNNPINSEIDFLVARCQKECEVARVMLENARKNNDYYREKAVSKLSAFLDAELGMLTRYAELKINYKELADVIDETRPYLDFLYKNAVIKWQVFKQKINEHKHGG